MMTDSIIDVIEGSTDIIHNYTGLWTVSDYGNTPVYSSGVSGKIIISGKDKNILRRLAGKVA